ncbi:unnamed protein product [Toxocara canis]|uniref:Methyltransferase-like protein 5 n=1 Tax=Toxocara canis TaxID=6265 RepID=A0A183UYY7_TOXCA|nr:unnamed protein product [Toxocara canis]
MRRFKKQKHFQWFLSELETFSEPKQCLEQYATSPELAVAILDAVADDGQIEGCCVADLGCGCGILALAAAQLGASYCLGVDIDDDVLAICQRNVASSELNGVVELVQLDVTKSAIVLRPIFDTVIMNPPFGTKNNAGIDIKFVEAALSLVVDEGCVYSLHKTATRNYIMKSAKRLNVEAECVAELRWNLPATYKHHRKVSVDIDVDLVRYVKMCNSS